MGILGKIFGSTDVIKAGIDLIDDMHTSDEEEIAAKVQGKVDLLNSYAPFRIAQRVLAIMFASTFLLSFFTVLFMTLAGKGNPADVTLVLGQFYIGEIMLTIVVFYFGGGFLEGTVEKFKKGNTK